MTERRMPIFRRRIGLTSNYSGGPPLTQVNGKSIQPPKRQKVKASSYFMEGGSDPLYDPITAPPESSDDEAEDARTKTAASNDDQDSDEDYNRHRTANIRATTFGNATSTAKATRPFQALGEKSHSSRIGDGSSLAGSKRSAEEDQPKAANQLERELDSPLQRKKKRQSMTKYGSQQKTKRSNASQSTSSSTQDISQPNSTNKSFHRARSISPIKSQSPRKSFKIKKQSSDLSDLDEPDTSKPSFKTLPRHDSSPFSTPGRRGLRHVNPVDEFSEDDELKSANIKPKASRVDLLSRRGSLKGRRRSPGPKAEELTPRPIFKVPGLEDLGSFDDSGSPDVTATPGMSQDTAWDFPEMEEITSSSTATCPMCHQEVECELLEKYSADGKMSVKQQTAFCRLHKRQSAAKAGTEKGYPEIDWETMDNRCSTHQDFLHDILEGTRASHYRKILKERVDSGKNRTLLTNHDNLTPGYYGPRGLQVMTEYIMGTLSDVIRRRAVEDKLISARTYTGYVQTVLVPELAVRLIMEDMSVTEERARDVLEESIEIGELLHEEARDVVKIDEKEENSFESG
ncbi:RTC4-like domain-containing protein [Xylaria curta]|nr:RTC4-like domain-containing protein [Xylaria curta]